MSDDLDDVELAPMLVYRASSLPASDAGWTLVPDVDPIRTRQACGMIRRIHDMPPAMLGRLTAKQRHSIAADLRTLATQAEQTAALLEATSTPEEEEEEA